MVLLAMFRASGGGTGKVPYEDLVLQAWKDYPSAFSLRNHSEHPDASDIHKRLYQSLKSNGLVVSLGNKCFRLTDDGVLQAHRLTRAATDLTTPVAKRLSRDDETFLQHAVSTRAFTRWKAGHREDLVDHDARLFFGYGVSTTRQTRRERVKRASEAIDRACASHVPDGDVLRQLADHLETSFLT